MNKKSVANELDDTNETTEATLAALTNQVSKFVREGTLDSRFAAKLAKRLKKEADAISDSGNTTKPGQKELNSAFGQLDAALRDHDAKLLVEANAALRASDAVVGAGKKSR
ncbi:hypothetical protein PQR02_09015 [Paraburkholderia sediminicola]|uniref:Uncharacterized protein n=1 Tax=Paraburkholderia rhynchosiae TaxID=487049 RepID=A0ACC7N854_9BURK